jgi:spore coat protein CotH
MLKKYIQLMLIVLIVLTLTACGIDGGGDLKPSATIQSGLNIGNKDDYKHIFKDNDILEISITIDPAYLEEMYAYPDGYEYYSATVKVNDQEIKNTGIRIMGNTDLDGGDESAYRYSYRLKFDKFVKGQTIDGLDELVLSNVSRDPSYMREFLLCEAFEKVELVAPLATYATVTINDNLVGFYVAIESVDDSFLKRNFGNNKGNLYKSNEQATLVDHNSLSLMEQKNGSDETKEDLQLLIDTLNSMPLGEKGDIENIMHVDSVLKYIAVNTVMGNYDSYIGASATNYYLYNVNNKLYMVPWDFNLSFGAQKKDNGVSVATPVDSPVYRAVITERPLVYKILSVEEYYNKYLEYVDICKNFLQDFENRVNEIDSIISDYIKNDPSSFYSYENYLANIGKSEENTAGIIAITEYASIRRDFLG